MNDISSNDTPALKPHTNPASHQQLDQPQLSTWPLGKTDGQSVLQPPFQLPYLQLVAHLHHLSWTMGLLTGMASKEIARATSTTIKRRRYTIASHPSTVLSRSLNRISCEGPLREIPALLLTQLFNLKFLLAMSYHRHVSFPLLFTAERSICINTSALFPKKALLACFFRPSTMEIQQRTMGVIRTT